MPRITEQSKWEMHQERRIKEKHTRERQWVRIKKEAYNWFEEKNK